MPIKTPEARRLCTESEFQLYTSSLPKGIKTLTPAVLRRKIERTRKLRDKWRDQAKRQRLEVRGKQEPRGVRAATASEGAARKAELFSETLDRFEERQRQLEAAGETAAAKPVKKQVAAKPTAADRKSSTRTKRSAVRKKLSLARQEGFLEPPGTATTGEFRRAGDVPTPPAAKKTKKKSSR